MSTHRETYFTCTYASDHARHTALVPAWDAGTAESLFRALLQDERVGDESGVIEIEAPRGQVRRRTPYAPRRA